MSSLISQEYCKKNFNGQWLSQTFQADLVSVVIPTFNRAKFLEKTMESVFQQTYRPLELIIVDDGSTDNTADMLNKWESKCSNDSNFYIRSLYQKNRGAPAARNLGVTVSKGEYIQFLDSDDLLHPEKLKRQMNYSLTKPNTILCGNWEYFWEENSQYKKKAGESIDLNKDVLEQWLNGHFFAPHSLLWPRNVVNRIGPWDESLLREQDGDYFLRAVLHNEKLIFIPEASCYYRINPFATSISTNPVTDAITSRIRVVQKLRLTLEQRGEFNQKYRNAMAHWFNRAAISYASVEPEIANWCYLQYKNLSCDRWIPGCLISHFAIRTVKRKNKKNFFDLKLELDAKKRWKEFIFLVNDYSIARSLVSFLSLSITHPFWLIKNLPQKIFAKLFNFK